MKKEYEVVMKITGYFKATVEAESAEEAAAIAVSDNFDSADFGPLYNIEGEILHAETV